MNTPIQVGITGGIGSGKSLVCKIFRCLEVPVYDADHQAKELMASDGILRDQIKKEFGEKAYDQHGNPDRQYLARTVFEVKENLEKLNRLVHPRVKINYQQWVTSQSAKSYLMKEAALLFEAGTFRELDKIIVVSAPESLRIKRVLMRDPQRTERAVRDIIRNQMPEEEKIKRADFVIVNDESRLIIPQVLELHSLIMNA